MASRVSEEDVVGERAEDTNLDRYSHPHLLIKPALVELIGSSVDIHIMQLFAENHFGYEVGPTE